MAASSFGCAPKMVARKFYIKRRPGEEVHVRR